MEIPSVRHWVLGWLKHQSVARLLHALVEGALQEGREGSCRSGQLFCFYFDGSVKYMPPNNENLEMSSSFERPILISKSC